jgi:hypothetical protein
VTEPKTARELIRADHEVGELGSAESEALRDRAEVAFEPMLAALEQSVPTSWLDPLLTGPSAVIGEGPYTCTDIERLLNAIRLRMKPALAVADGKEPR